ncbi:putative isomerase YbhE [Corynespora cassiicola Philippines]|uniref:Putative isomerase YbhE n=1 Tax=Corynespora cassiicola Philippines TaxID=1448308 RepID=A0A2T2PD09_CORCC|nr:putative isomerase YbhE [Corynespora cassiicola Philippines]
MRGFDLGAVLSSALLVSSSSAIKLYAAQSDGNLTTLNFSPGSPRKAPGLTAVANTIECAGNPSHLNLDFPNRILYCLDRGRSGATEGSLNSFSIGRNGSLSRIARTTAPPSGVFAEIFDTAADVRGYVSSSYNRSSVASWILGENGALTGPLETIFPTINQTGPVAARQDASYAHHVILDPTGKFILIPDLGGDMVRVYSYNDETISPLEELSPLVSDPGAGPRHAAFWESPSGELFLFFNGELSQKVYSYRVEYTETGLAFTKNFEINGLDVEYPATTAPTSELAVSPDGRFVVVSHREKSFRNSPIVGSGPSDSLSTFSINDDGTLELVQVANSGGWSPRQFSINKAGDMLAVGHQGNNSVIIWKRDVQSGKIVPEEEGGKLGEVIINGPVVYTQWDE